jgi:hypothetical protein
LFLLIATEKRPSANALVLSVNSIPRRSARKQHDARRRNGPFGVVQFESLDPLAAYGFDWQHPGAGNNVLVINGHGAANLCCLSFFGPHFEGSNTDTTTPFVSIADAKNISFYSPLFNSLDSGTTNRGLSISHTSGGLTDDVVMFSATHGNANFVTNSINSQSISDGSNVLP